MNWLSDPAALRAAVFFGVLGLLLGLERLWPRRHNRLPWQLRWTANLGLAALGAALLALLPLAALGASMLAQAHGWGLFNGVDLPPVVEGLLAWLALDCALYWQHRWMHERPLLWRLHRVHHSDPELDATTGLRFHPAELLVSMLWKMAVVTALGAPPLAVLVFELTLNGLALWSHANLELPARLDAGLRRLVLTPDVHRVHHSILPQETNSNYGSALMVWDHLFGSYRAQPQEGHEGLRIGLTGYGDATRQRLAALLLQPTRE